MRKLHAARCQILSSGPRYYALFRPHIGCNSVVHRHLLSPPLVTSIHYIRRAQSGCISSTICGKDIRVRSRSHRNCISSFAVLDRRMLVKPLQRSGPCLTHCRREPCHTIRCRYRNAFIQHSYMTCLINPQSPTVPMCAIARRYPFPT